MANYTRTKNQPIFENKPDMRNTAFYYLAIITLLFAACSKEGLEAKKEQLQSYKDEVRELNTKIKELETEIAALDSTYGVEEGKAILVNTKVVKATDFKHKIEVRGSVESRRNVMLTSETAGTIESVKVREGQKVSAGQTLIVLDADILRNNIAELKTSLELAKVVYERQANLWEKKIGTEIQYLEAKNNKEAIERRLATAHSQLDQAVVKAPFAGVIDELPAREGEMAQPGVDLVRVVSPEMMYIDADVSERYISDFKVGDEVDLYFPVQDKHITSKISAVSEVIKSDNRTFSIEVKLPKLDFPVKPNQVVVLELTDYEAESALVVPTEIILSDGDDNFLYTAEDENNKTVAKKTKVKVGESYDGVTEVKEGLKQNDIVVIEGYRSLSDGVAVKAADKSTKTAQLK
ncbi:efflux RND transporter periplasmic adaptor subunit [Fulvivirga maritima]|uniref:efflux RND transporter periplasmic adaptor subunit n=1 Tax=Fulvivirga maritima TaxID=2904247 RepID=UPI001F33F7AA|nr:efflux RND transporter periplasmic adaptor subunit [Fulvivirga maritima]UII29425.1 efflux RND transporter periplasmic adaptor subunit [Fulvivirga maritima]